MSDEPSPTETNDDVTGVRINARLYPSNCDTAEIRTVAFGLDGHPNIFIEPSDEQPEEEGTISFDVTASSVDDLEELAGVLECVLEAIKAHLPQED